MLKSGYRYKYSGVNQERMFNKLCVDYNLFNIKKHSKRTGEFCVSIKSSKELEKIFSKNNFVIEEKKGFGFLYHICNFLKRYGVLAGLFVAFVFFCVISNFVFAVDVVGLEKIERKQVLDILSNNGFEKINAKNSIDCDRFEKSLASELKNISLVSIIIKGNTLIVSIKEKVDNAEYENKEDFKPICSEYDGVITDITLVQGTLNVRVGDVIKKGDELVLPYIIDSSGQTRKVEPKAEIFARIYISENQDWYDTEMVSIRTGKKQTATTISAFGLNIFLNKQKCKFDKYEMISSTVAISKNNILPIYRETITYYELKTTMQENDFQEKKLEVLENLKQKALEKITKYDIIENEREKITSVAGKNTLNFVLEVKKRIC